MLHGKPFPPFIKYRVCRFEFILIHFSRENTMKKLTFLTSLIFVTGLLLAISPANASQKWQDITATQEIPDNARAAAICQSALSDWRKINCASSTCTARWNGQWRNVDAPDTDNSKKMALCGTHVLERSSWLEQPLSFRPLNAEENRVSCRYKGNNITNGWQYDDICRDRLDMMSSHLNHVTMIDSISNANTQQIIKGLKGEASSKKMPDGRYIFVLRKYANDPDRLGLVLRRYDRNDIQKTGQICKNDTFSYADNMEKTIPKNNPGHVRHSQLNDGWNPVYSAGELWIKNGQIVVISNESGHFKPSKASLDSVKETLDYLTIPTGNIHFYDFNKDKKALNVYKNQCAGGKILNRNESL